MAYANQVKELFTTAPKALVITYGCQQNENDSELICGMLAAMGYTFTEDKSEADLILFNTCAVREGAELRVLGNIGALVHEKRRRPGLIVGICGCMMQQEHMVKTIRSKYKHVSLVFGTHTLHQLPQLLFEAITGQNRVFSVEDSEGVIVEDIPVYRKGDPKAWVSVMYGCNNFCTYCIVPYVRGRERSRDPERVLEEVRELVADGVKEITLLGQNVNSYRGDSQQDGKTWDFTDLIWALADIEGLERIRFMTSHPKDLSDKLIDAFARCDKLCNYIHLPVQAGSSSVLKRMNRKYTQEKYLDLVRKLRTAVPDIAISTDIIVGFPGETEEDFLQTLKLAEEVRYDSAFTFLYSPRPGTPAAEYEDQISEEVKHERFGRLVETMNRISAEKNAAYVGRVCDVLVDGPDKKAKGRLSGRTEEFKLVDFEGPEEITGQIVKVEITGSNTFSLRGRLV